VLRGHLEVAEVDPGLGRLRVLLAEAREQAPDDLLRAPAVDVREHQHRALARQAEDGIVHAQGALHVVDDLGEDQISLGAGHPDHPRRERVPGGEALRTPEQLAQPERIGVASVDRHLAHHHALSSYPCDLDAASLSCRGLPTVLRLAGGWMLAEAGRVRARCARGAAAGRGLPALLGLTWGLIVLGALVRARRRRARLPRLAALFRRAGAALRSEGRLRIRARVTAGGLAAFAGPGRLALRRARRRGARPRGCSRSRRACSPCRSCSGALTVWHLLASWSVTAHLLTGTSFALVLLLLACALRDLAAPPGRAARASPASARALGLAPRCSRPDRALGRTRLLALRRPRLPGMADLQRRPLVPDLERERRAAPAAPQQRLPAARRAGRRGLAEPPRRGPARTRLRGPRDRDRAGRCRDRERRPGPSHRGDGRTGAGDGARGSAHPRVRDRRARAAVGARRERPARLLLAAALGWLPRR
jgi:hypothetical protein